jgi:V8-like Glu-specific endopeptidase
MQGARVDPQRLDKTLWPQVGLIRSYFPLLNGWYALGTGTLINPRAILTAGHVIYDSAADRGGRANRFEVFFGGGATATAAGSNGRVLQEWIDSDTHDPVSAYDAGVILLDPTNAVPGVTPAAVLPSLIGDIVGHEVNMVGYPFRPDLTGNLAGAAGSPIDMGSPLDAYRVAYTVVSIEGMSGGPVYRTDEASRQISIRAVNTSIYNGLGNGLMIYPALGTWIAKWVAEVT